MSYQSMLAERREASKNEARNILNRASAEKRNLTDIEQRDFDRIKADLDSQNQAADSINQREADSVKLDAISREFAGRPIDNRYAVKPAETREIEDKFRSAMLERNPAPIEIIDPSPRSYYQPGVEARALGKGSGGVNMQGVGFYNKIIANMVETSAVLRAGATVISTDNGEDLRVPRQTAFGAASLVAEGAIIPEGDPALSAITLGAFKYAQLITVSNELAEDAAFDLSSYLANMVGTSIGNALGADLINGTGGSTAPTGVLTDATLGLTGPVGTSTSLGAQGNVGQGTDILNSLWGSLAEPYTRSSAAGFLCRTSTLTNVRNLKGSTGDLVGHGFITQAPAPFHVDPFVANQAPNAKSILFGDWSRVLVRIVNGIRFEQSRDFAFNSDQTVFRAALRADGRLVDNTGAIKWFANSAT